jgi:hypothetical protein
MQLCYTCYYWGSPRPFKDTMKYTPRIPLERTRLLSIWGGSGITGTLSLLSQKDRFGHQFKASSNTAPDSPRTHQEGANKGGIGTY